MSENLCPICKGEVLSYGPWKENNQNLQQVNCRICGIFGISSQLHISTVGTPTILEYIGGKYKGKEYILSGVTRNAHEKGDKEIITQENIVELIDSASIPEGHFEIIDKILLHIYNKSTSADEYILIATYDYPLFYTKKSEELMYYVKQAKTMGFIEHGDSSDLFQSYRLTPQGWERVNELRRKRPDSKKVFIAMWYDIEEKYKKTCEKAFIPALKETGFEPAIMVFLEHNEKIDDQIMVEIKGSKFLIADLTGSRGSVLWEAGFAMGLGIKVIWTCHKDWLNEEKIPFTIRQFNYIDWKEHDDLKKRLINRIKNTIL